MNIVGLAVANQKTPAGCDGKTIRYVAQTAATGTDQINLSQAVASGQIDQIQGVYIDALECTDPVFIVCGGTGHRIVCPAGQQMWTPLLSQNPPTFGFACADKVNQPTFFFTNFSVPFGETQVSSGGGSSEWNAGTVTFVGPGLSLNSGTIEAAWAGGTVDAIGAGLALNSGTISAEWTGGTVNAIGHGLTLNGGALAVSGLAWADLPSEAQQLPLAVPLGTPAASQEWLIALAGAYTLPVNMAGSIGFAGTAPTAAASFTLAYNRAGTVSNLGTITFAASTGAVSFSGPAAQYQSAAGDVLILTAPASVDASFANGTLTFLFAKV